MANANSTPTPLRASAKPIDSQASQHGEDVIPTHTEPFKAFDWVGIDGSRHTFNPAEAVLSGFINDTINVCSGVALALRMIEQCNSVGELSPELVTFSDGTQMEQEEVPYLSPGQCAELGALAATAASMLADQAHRHAQWLRDSQRIKVVRAGH